MDDQFHFSSSEKRGRSFLADPWGGSGVCCNLERGRTPLMAFDWPGGGGGYVLGFFGTGVVSNLLRSPDLDAWFRAAVLGHHAAAGPFVDWLIEHGPREVAERLESILSGSPQ